MTEKGIEVVMNALAGTPTVVTADFANEVEQILREKIQIEKENGGNCHESRSKSKNTLLKWDDGRTILESPCKVNLITHEILHIGRRKIICSPYPNRVLDDYVEHLDAEYVRFADGTCCNVVDYQSTWSFKEQCGIAPFYRS